jgi:hypothetical protein
MQLFALIDANERVECAGCIWYFHLKMTSQINMGNGWGDEVGYETGRLTDIIMQTKNGFIMVRVVLKSAGGHPDLDFSLIGFPSRVFHQSLGPAAMCISALKRTHRPREKRLAINIYSIAFVSIFLCRENLISFLKKSTTMTRWLNVLHDGAAINLLVSRAEITFSSGHPQRIYECAWCGCNRLADGHSVSTAATLPHDFR